jgi:hypothetical protein
MAPNTVRQRLAALRFFYVQVLKRGCETPYPKKVLHLPQVLSQQEVVRPIDAADLGFGVEEKDSIGVQEDRHHGSGLAHISAHGGSHAGRDGRAPIDDPRLLASQRSAHDQQVSPGNDKKQTPRAGEARGCHSARGRALGKQINLDPLAREVRVTWMGRNSESADGKRLLDSNGPRMGFSGPL